MRVAVLPALVLLAGCTLIDQRTFNPDAGMRPTIPPPPVAAAPESGPRPLLVVRPPVAAEAVRLDVARAVTAATRIKRDVVFDVVETTSGGGEGGSAGFGQQAETVGRMIVAQGIPPARVHLAGRPIASGQAEVRVYVR